MVTTESLKSYFEKARRFDQERMIQIERSNRLAWSIALAASLVAVVSILVVAALTPLKTVEPFVVRVDNSTGIVDVVSALTSTAAREGYVWSEAQTNFRTVALLSTQAEQDRFASHYRGSNPGSPQVIYGRAATTKIRIASISLINQNVASVRTVTRGDEVRTTHWIASLTYAYANAPMSSTDRLVNPLGFAVSEYRSDPEAIN